MTLPVILLIAALSLLLRAPFLARLRPWLLLTLSALAVFYLQPLTPIRYLDFWLPVLTLLLTLLAWLLQTPPEDRIPRLSRENYTAAALLALTALTAAATRFIAFDPILTASRPPQFALVLAVILAAAALAGLTARFAPLRPRWLGAAIFTLLALFLILKTPALALLAARGLRALAGQSPDLAAAADLRWLGFSYIAFRLIHTLRDRQTSPRAARTDLRSYVIYVLFPPALAAGPIDRLDRFTRDLAQPPAPLAEDLLPAGQRLTLGLLKKFVLADSLAVIALTPQAAAQTHSPLWMALMVYAYAFQIYLDFSGYTDIAIGLGRLSGIRLPENFNQPYRKPNLTQFWNNWHMTLTQWIRAYVFNPLTRALRTTARPLPVWAILLIGQTLTMLLIGLWHGLTLNFLIWGLWHALGLFVQNRWSAWAAVRLKNVLAHPAVRPLGPLLTFHYVALGWVWFALPHPAQTWHVFRTLLGW